MGRVSFAAPGRSEELGLCGLSLDRPDSELEGLGKASGRTSRGGQVYRPITEELTQIRPNTRFLCCFG